MELADISITTIAKITATEAEAYRFMEWLRWQDGEPACAHCGTKGNAVHLEPRNGGRKTRSGKISERRVWQCRSCRKQFTAIVGTVFERSHLPLQRWLLGMYMMFTAKNGVSARELSRALGITIKAAWFMGHRLRFAMAGDDAGEPLKGIVQADETYVGSVIHGKGKGAYTQNKTPVVTLVQRGGAVRSRSVPTIDGTNLAKALRDNMAESAILMTDTNPGYVKPGRAYAGHFAVAPQPR